ncbi:MAG: hypothetical protein KDA60_20655, partial [Planctomycetales bacterium]|nr:hypothetical protein [Planctomycetales bacterium]
LPIMCGVLFLSYPYLQLSTLETESPLLPFSLEVARTFRYAPIAWLVFYVSWGVGLSVVFAVMLALARSSVWLAAAVFGPTAATIVVGYAVSLGRLARHLDDAISAEEDEDDEDD